MSRASSCEWLLLTVRFVGYVDNESEGGLREDLARRRQRGLLLADDYEGYDSDD